MLSTPQYNDYILTFFHFQGVTPLMNAARSSTPELVHCLLASGADVAVQDANVTHS